MYSKFLANMIYRDFSLLLCLLCIFVANVYASFGDRSLSFRKCFRTCALDCPLEGHGTS